MSDKPTTSQVSGEEIVRAAEAIVRSNQELLQGLRGGFIVPPQGQPQFSGGFGSGFMTAGAPGLSAEEEQAEREASRILAKIEQRLSALEERVAKLKWRNGL
jgi:hypothetical protein